MNNSTTPILYVDIDDTLNYYTQHFIINKTGDIEFPQSIEGFYLTIPANIEGINVIKELYQYYDIYFLTAPSLKNPHSYTEKRLWIEKYFGYDWVHRLIICNHKNLLMGDYLIDDKNSGKGQDKFTGKLIQYTSTNTWENIREYFLNIVEEKKYSNEIELYIMNKYLC